MRNLLYVTLALLAVAIGVSSLVIAESVRDFCAETVHAERSIEALVDAIPATVDQRLVSLQAETLKLVDQHAKAIEGSLGEAAKEANARLGFIQDDVVEQLGAANRSIATVADSATSAIPTVSKSAAESLSSVAVDVHSVAAPSAAIANQVNEASPMFLDCQYNPDCAFNRFQGTSKSIEKTMLTIATAAPQVAASAIKIEDHADHITAAVEKEVDELSKPKRWYQKIGSFVGLAATAAAHLI